MEKEKTEINFICPICKIEVKENDNIYFDLENLQMIHEECQEKNGSKDNNN